MTAVKKLNNFLFSFKIIPSTLRRAQRALQVAEGHHPSTGLFLPTRPPRGAWVFRWTFSPLPPPLPSNLQICQWPLTVLYCTVLYYNNNNNNDRDKWDSMKNIIGWKKSSTPTLLSNEGKLSTSPKEIARILNHHLVGKVAATARKIPKTKTDPLTNYAKMMEGKDCKFKIKQMTTQDLRNTILKMKSSQLAGMDNISSRMLKELLRELEKPLTNLVNQSIRSKEYPQSLKKSKVIPILKNNNKPTTDPASYRGVNLIMTIGKVIDKIILGQVLTYLKTNNLIHEAHHGGLKGKSTTTAITTLVDTWTNLGLTAY